MRKHLSSLFQHGKEIFRGSAAECNREIYRIIAAEGIYQFRGKFHRQDGTEIQVNIGSGDIPELGLKRIPDSKKKKSL